MNVNSYQPYARTAQTGRAPAFGIHINESERSFIEPERNLHIAGAGIALRNMAKYMQFDASTIPGEAAYPQLIKSMYDCKDMPVKDFAIGLDRELRDNMSGYKSPLQEQS